jgi:hypothetical protein
VPVEAHARGAAHAQREQQLCSLAGFEPDKVPEHLKMSLLELWGVQSSHVPEICTHVYTALLQALKPQVSFILGRLKATDCAFSCLGVPEADFNIWQFCIVMAKHVCLIAVMG